MPVVMNVNEAKSNFSSILANVENNSASVTIVRYGRPVARIVPIATMRDTSPMASLVNGAVRFDGDWFDATGDEWENA